MHTSNARGMPKSNAFGRVLTQFNTKERLILRLIHDLELVSTALLKEAFPEESDVKLGVSLLVLVGCGAVRRERSFWICTWFGAGVSNWCQQLRWLEFLPKRPSPIPGPHLGETVMTLGLLAISIDLPSFRQGVVGAVGVSTITLTRC